MTDASDERVRAEMMSAALLNFLRMEQSLRAAAQHLAAAEAIHDAGHGTAGRPESPPFPPRSAVDA